MGGSDGGIRGGSGEGPGGVLLCVCAPPPHPPHVHCGGLHCHVISFNEDAGRRWDVAGRRHHFGKSLPPPPTPPYYYHPLSYYYISKIGRAS